MPLVTPDRLGRVTASMTEQPRERGCLLPGSGPDPLLGTQDLALLRSRVDA